MMTSKKVIELFYDVVSPYSWLGFEVMCRYRQVWNIELKLRPAFLGGIMHGSGNKPPGLVPKKFLYMAKDLNRLAGYFGVPLQTPSDPFEAMFNKGSLSAMRFVTAVQEREKDGDKQVEQVCRELWKRIWSDDKDITEPGSLSEAAMKAGLSDSEIKEALKLSTTKEIKDKLKRVTQEALDHGAFGLPLLVCHVNGKPEMFFGSDRFELMAHCIGEKWLGPQPGKSSAKLMSSVSEADFRCQHGDTICEIRVYEQEVIVVPILLLAAFLVTLVFILLLRFCPEKVDRIRPKPSKPTTRRVLHGIDAPPGINALEGESIALDMPSSYSTFHPPTTYPSKNFSTSVVTPSFHPAPTTAHQAQFHSRCPAQRAAPARMENRNVVLRVLKDTADATERHSFLGFASFLSQLGPHPFLPELLGVVSLRAPLVTVVEELENRDMLSFLWRCRQEKVDPPCEMTERRIFTMAKHVASALEFLHNKDILHGNVCARSVLVSKEYTAKLWGLHGSTQGRTMEPHREMIQHEEMAGARGVSQEINRPSSDIWSFGVLLYEMATLGEAPFAEISVNELLQFHQRGKSLKKPSNCSNTLYSVIKACCQWKDQDRPMLPEVSRKLCRERKAHLTKSSRWRGRLTLSGTCRKQDTGKPTATLFSDHCLCQQTKLHYFPQWYPNGALPQNNI
ncbi:Glutathione S-transferase kappa 1 [Larimichthys crocea]|uniref:Glutathione S-transferase kappa 1 n=1 Tax=Larimichthys crocea TaxID=215358 RepID=A0A6G0IBR9_LARCR|nr:Glutathione S-transferase kappa 1 [Larimichthys crocea]